MPLAIESLEISYGNKRVVRGASMRVGEKEIVAVIGHNGAGKTTLVNGVFGVLPTAGGTVTWNGRDITNRSPAANLRDGISYSPQGAQVYRTLSIAENLVLGGFAVKDRDTVAGNIEKVYELFPVLYERRKSKAGLLSGGERQMLSIGAMLASSPRLALLDEPSGGLAPMLVERVFDSIRSIVDAFDTSILLVEQNVQQAFAIADRAYVMTNGNIIMEGTPEEMERSGELTNRYFSAREAIELAPRNAGSASDRASDDAPQVEEADDEIRNLG